MASGSAEDKTLSNTPSWRIAVLILVFIVITLLWEKGTDKIEHFLSSRKRLGLRHVIHKVEEELLALGLISLILIALQDPLSHLCIDKPGHHKDDHEPGYDDKHSPSPYEKEDSGHDGSHNGGHARRLTASGGGGDSCPEGQEPFWSTSTTHQTHIFIFLLALVHIAYAMLSMLICLWKVRRWKKWEEMADHNLVDVTNKHLLSRSNPFSYYWDAWTASFTESIDRSVYLGLRRLFIERMSLTDSFNFHEFLVNSMEEEFSKVVKMEWLMWVIVGIWILSPPYVMFIMTGFAVIIMIIVGTQLELVAIKLSHQAYLSYGDRPTLNRQETSLIRRSLATISKGLRRGSKKHNTDGEVRHEVKMERRPSHAQAHSDDLDLFMAKDKRRPSTLTRTGSYSLDHSGRGKDLSTQEITSSGGPSAGTAPDKGAGMDLQHGSQIHSAYSSSSEDEYQTDTPLHRGPRVGEASFRESEDGKPGTSFGHVDDKEKLGGAPVMESRDQEKTPFSFRAQTFARAVDWAIGGKKHEEERLQMQMDTFAESYAVADSAQLFWLRRPRLMLRAVQFTYFETSIVVAILLFNMWQDTAFIVSKNFGNHNWLTFGLVILGVLLMLHSAYFVLPVYALTMAAGSHCPRSILKLAKKKKIKPKMVNALERMSYNPFSQGTTSAEAAAPDVMIDMDWEREMEQAAGEAEEKTQNSISTLLGAMFQEKAKEFALARRSYHTHSEDISSLQPIWMSETSPRSHGKSPMTITDPELLPKQHAKPKSPLRSESGPPEAAEFRRMPTFADMGGEDEHNAIGSSGGRRAQSLGGGDHSLNANKGMMGGSSSADGGGVGPSVEGRISPVDLGIHSRKSGQSFDSQTSEVMGGRRMPSQTILDEPDAYTRKCTIYGSHATLHEIALLFKQAEQPRKRRGEHGRRRGSS